MRIALLGATGVVGRRMLPRLLARGHAVRAASRSASSDRALALAGAQPVRCDLLDAQSLAALLPGCDAVVNLATAVPPPGAAGDWALNDRIRREGTRNLLAGCLAHGVPSLVQQSVAMLHCAEDRSPQGEDSGRVGYGVLASALDMEAALGASTLEWRIVRGGLLYGPGTGYPEAWQRALADPAFRIPGDGTAWLSLIQVDDLAAALEHVLACSPPREAYIACDDAPLTWSALFGELARRAGRAPPSAGGPPRLRSFRASNAKLRALGWRPACASVWHGLADPALSLAVPLG